MDRRKTCAVIGGGPAGLMAAEVLAEGGCAVTIYDQMPSIGRKFLMAGIGGLNLTHSEDMADFLRRYRGISLADAISAFSPDDLRSWCEAIGHETFVGSSGRVFPRAFKASPLLRSWLERLVGLGVEIRTGHRFAGWNGDSLTFGTAEGEFKGTADAVIFATGGASWPRLGSNGEWVTPFRDAGVKVTPFLPSNCGFETGWREHVGKKFGGAPLKPVALTFGNETVRGEATVTENGIEGGAVYALSPLLRDAIIVDGRAVLYIDLKPDVAVEQLEKKLGDARRGDSLANRLRKLGLTPAAVAVLREGTHPLPAEPGILARAIKSVPLTLNEPMGIERAISTAGGIAGEAIDATLMLRARPGCFVAGEMIDWEAPTGGYLLQACFASGRQAGRSALAWLQ